MTTTHPHAAALASLRDEDNRTDLPPRASLAPGRDRPTPLHTLGAHLLTPDLPPDTAEAFTHGLITLYRAQREHFPNTIFLDMDRLAADLLGTHPDPDSIEVRAEVIARLQAAFGCHSPIRFRYVHDFTYGFDWARWVRKQPQQRAHIGPFDIPFLHHMIRRAGELLELIDLHDATYPPLPDGTSRNPFTFARDPDSEHLLYTALAARDLLPVHAWDTQPHDRWDLPFKELRDQLAVDLGLPSKPEGGA